MDKINVAVVGYGNIGRFAVEAVLSAADMNLAGIVRRDAGCRELNGVKVTDDITALGKVDVAVLCVPSRNVPAEAEKYLKMGIHTVDSFDIHSSIYDLKQQLNVTAKANNASSIISAGWDPGSDSVLRALLEACAPKGLTYTNFGPGMSMGHTVVAKSKDGVKNALSITIPAGSGVHKRMIYIELEDGADFETAKKAILEDSYFCHDDCRVEAVTSVNALMDMGHGVLLTRKGVSGNTDNQLFTFDMRINNPALTSQLMVSAARAATRQRPGAYTMIEIPPVDLLPGERENIIKRLV